MPIQLAKPIVARLISDRLSHADRVEKTSRNGNPAEKPRNRNVTTRGCA